MKYHYNLILRLLIPFILNIKVLFIILFPLTIYSVYFFFKLFNYNILINKEILTINNQQFIFVQACIASSAYFLLLLLIVLTKDLSWKKMFKLFILGSLIILIANIIRVITLLLISLNLSVNWFQLIHLFIWNFLATLFIVFLWIFLTKIFKIKTIPVYSDFKFLLNNSLFKKKGLNK